MYIFEKFYNMNIRFRRILRLPKENYKIKDLIHNKRYFMLAVGYCLLYTHYFIIYSIPDGINGSTSMPVTRVRTPAKSEFLCSACTYSGCRGSNTLCEDILLVSDDQWRHWEIRKIEMNARSKCWCYPLNIVTWYDYKITPGIYFIYSYVYMIIL